MTTYFALGKHRSVLEAFYVVYMKPMEHPSRLFPPFHDLVYMDSGSWSFRLDGKTFEVMPGDVFILPAGIAHNGLHACTSGTKTYYIHIHPTTGDTTDDVCPSSDGIARLPLSTVIHCQDNMLVRSLFDEIVQLAASNYPERGEVISPLLETLLYFLHQCGKSSALRSQNIVNRCLDIMNASPNRFFKEVDMAKQCFTSVKTLRASFIKRYGKTFYQYQLESKLSQVCRYLSEQPDMKLSAIADDFGFCDEFHLSKVFKRTYGISPSSYRKKVQSEMEMRTEPIKTTPYNSD